MVRLIAAAVVALGLLHGAGADAAFPGRDGLVVFTRGGDLWVAEPDGSGLRALTSTPAIEEAQAAWSPDGSRIAFRVGTPDTSQVLQIATMNADGSGRATVTSATATAPQPGWSPDGTQIIFRRSTPGDASSGDVWVMGADGTSRAAAGCARG